MRMSGVVYGWGTEDRCVMPHCVYAGSVVVRESFTREGVRMVELRAYCGEHVGQAMGERVTA